MPSTNFPPFLVLGKVSVPVAGTPVGLLDAFVPQGGVAGGLKSSGGVAKIRVSSILFAAIGIAALNLNTGFVYIGVKGMNKATGVGVIFAIPAPTAGIVNFFTLPSAGWGGGNELAPEDIFLDADTGGNSVEVTCTQY